MTGSFGLLYIFLIVYIKSENIIAYQVSSARGENAQHRDYVILSEQSESKDLRTEATKRVTICAKILRFRASPSDQDDKTVYLPALQSQSDKQINFFLVLLRKGLHMT